MPLSDTALRNLKPRDKPYKKMDGQGLYVLVTTNGSRLWRFNFMLKGKTKTLAFGKYPAVTLAEARAQRDQARVQLDRKVDPTVKRKLDRIADAAAAENTFALLTKEYLEGLRHNGASKATMDKNTWLLEKLACADLGERPMAEITPANILALLKRVERSGRLETANRLRSAISCVFRLAVAMLKAPSDPTRDLRGAIKPAIVRNRTAITDEAQVGALMASIDSYDGWPTLRSGMLFTALTAARPGEVRAARWSEIDLAQRKWTIPAQRTKMRRDHVVPLSDQAIAVLNDIVQLTGRCALVFPSVRSDDRPLSENAMNSALRRMGYTQDEHTAHGFRSTFSTILNERGHDPEIIELCLAHQDGSVRGIYNRARKWAERTALMQTWADLLDGFRRLTQCGE